MEHLNRCIILCHVYLYATLFFLSSFPVRPPSHQRECGDLAEFTRQVLGPYSVNVTTATRLCSSALCQGRGRCVRQNPGSSAYLHMPAATKRVEEKVEEKEEEKVEDKEEVSQGSYLDERFSQRSKISH